MLKSALNYFSRTSFSRMLLRPEDNHYKLSNYNTNQKLMNNEHFPDIFHQFFCFLLQWHFLVPETCDRILLFFRVTLSQAKGFYRLLIFWWEINLTSFTLSS